MLKASSINPLSLSSISKDLATEMSDEVTRVSRPDNILVPSQNKMGWKYINKDKYFKFKQNKSDKDPTASLNVGKIPTLSRNKHVSFDQSKIENLTEDIKKNNVNRD